MKTFSLHDIKHYDLVEVVPNQDPNTSTRFCIPVPNYKSYIARDELSSKFWFMKEYNKPGKNSAEIRLFFKNFKDDCQQGAKIDGSGAIVFMGKSFNEWKTFLMYLLEKYPNIKKISPDDISGILTFSRVNYGIIDRYNENIDIIEKTMIPVVGLETETPGFGGFVYKKIISTAIYLEGEGQYVDGPAATPQIFLNGAFIIFPGITKKDLIDKFAKDFDSLKSKLVQKDVFLITRTFPDDSPLIL